MRTFWWNRGVTEKLIVLGVLAVLSWVLFYFVSSWLINEVVPNTPIRYISPSP